MLLERLRPMMAPSDTAGRYQHGNRLFSYCSIDRERLKAIELPNPLIGIILRGLKEVWLGDTVHVFEPGTVFVLPGGVRMDVVNIPGERSAYESLLLEVPSLPPGIAPLVGSPRCGSNGWQFSLPLNTDLIDALVHAATSIANDAMGEAVKTLRLTEVLMLMQPLAAARPLFRTSLSDEVAWLIRAAPAEAWTVERIADRLGLGASTLRRRLASEDRSFRKILCAERIKAGRNALASGASSLAAAEAAGYSSRSHFARRYRESYGTSPTGRRVG
ncbi:helix-turn-helix domain-containing protein [Rhizobium sullae]|uniref:helix-turn-helix domain-containing protein n=1 Tax=Rhizobium sullae TaxID=50338 RepID=UPI000B35BB6B|nr:helix-turn-helix domain-containing protein [Rhizobium sullae]